MSTSPAYVSFAELGRCAGLEVLLRLLQRRKGGWHFKREDVFTWEAGMDLLK